MMNNPLRAAFQRRVEARELLRLGGPVPGGRVLEIGCGRGVGAGIILDVFGARAVEAVDLDARMLARARQCGPFGGEVRFRQGDVTDLPDLSESYDAVFDFGALHHVPRWQCAVAEAFRVLRPGGRIYAQETMDRLITHPVSRRVWDHPQENRFDRQGFERGLREAGFRAVRRRMFFRYFGWFVAEKPAC